MNTSRESISELRHPPGQLGPGDWIGKKYQLKELRGAGGMGTVWVAHNAVLDIDVALKLMRFEQFKANPKRIFRRLLQEARAAARLEHPAIVRVFDFGLTDAGSPYIVMELLHGESLAELMGREPAMEATRAVQLLLPIADALATAHGRGIIHRDIKPENLFLATDDYDRLQPKIVDFGVARFLEGGRTMTRSGALMGTPDYMAPEQARGDADIDTRVDIWALCVVLYELVAGFRPFGGQNANYLAVLRAIVHDDPNPKIREIADDGLCVILERGLRKRAHERWDTMRVLGEALALWLYERGIREDVLGASIKANWLQSGLGGVKIETASMSPPAGEPQSLKIAESGSLPVLGPASVSAPDTVARPMVNVSLAGIRPLPRESLSLPSPREQAAAQETEFSLSDAIDAALDSSQPAPRQTASQSVEVDFSETESSAPASAQAAGRFSSSPLFEQARELRRLVLASIFVTAALALAVVGLLWDQRRVPSHDGAPPDASTERGSELAKVEQPEPSPPKTEPTSPAASSETAATAAPEPEPAASASSAAPQGLAEASLPVVPAKRVKPKARTYRRQKKTKYELGF